MYIITQGEPLENCIDNEYQVNADEVKKRYAGLGYRQYERRYKLKYQHKEYSVVCLEFRNDKEGAEPVIVVPEFLVPRRPYPVYVYLYAIDLYSNAPEKGQRWAAEKTRKQFGLESFCHTTLGRALKAFVRVLFGEPADASKDNSAKAPECKAAGFPTTQGTAGLRSQAACFLGHIRPWAVRAQAIADCCMLAKRIFMECRRFLL
jgi:hypothetical protein